MLNAGPDLLMRPFEGESAWPGLVAWSLVASLILVGLFRLSSNQHRLRAARNRLLARTLELLLFRHDLRVSLTSCGRIAVANLAYLGAIARPLAVSAVPMAVILIQMQCWFHGRPLRLDETVVVEARLAPDQARQSPPLELTASPLLQIDLPGVRIASTNETAWRVRAILSGEGWVEARCGDVTERKSVAVGDRLARLSFRRTRNAADSLLHPSEPMLSGDGPFEQIDVRYPERLLFAGDHTIHWLVASLALMMMFGIVLAKMFGVNLA